MTGPDRAASTSCRRSYESCVRRSCSGVERTGFGGSTTKESGRPGRGSDGCSTPTSSGSKSACSSLTISMRARPRALES